MDPASALLQKCHTPFADLDVVILPNAALLTLAAATLRRGTHFLGTGRALGHGAPAPRVIGNGLRELDRFLSLVIDAVALQAALSADDHRLLERTHNTARKLGLLRGHLALSSPDDAALRAIGRTRDCLFHTAGIVRAGARGSTPTAGWGHPDATATHGTLAPLALGLRIEVSIDDLRRIGHFYDRIAADLIAALDGHPVED